MPLHGTTKDENGTQIFKMNADFILFPRLPRFPRPIFRTVTDASFSNPAGIIHITITPIQ